MTRGKVPELKNIKIETLDLGETTLDDYLRELLKVLWVEGEDFKSKRPFGQEGWKWELNAALVEKYPTLGKIVNGRLWNVNEKLDKAVIARIEKIFKDAHDFNELITKGNISKITLLEPNEHKEFEEFRKNREKARLLKSAAKTDLKSVAPKKA